MENKEIRRANLAALIESHGSIRALADKVGTAPNYLSEIKNRERDMGDKLARKIEAALGLRPGWMDTVPSSSDSADDQSDKVYVKATSREDLLEQLSQKGDDDLADLLRMIAARLQSKKGS